MRAPVLAVAVFLLASTPSSGQLPDNVHAGVRVRVTSRQAGVSTTQEGMILQVRGDTLIIRPSNTPSLIAVSSRDITALDISGGKPISTWGAVKGAGTIGALIGGFIGFRHYKETDCLPPTTACRNGDMVIAGLQGAAIGGAIGALAGMMVKERWTPATTANTTPGNVSLRAPIRSDLRRALQVQLDSFRSAAHLPGVTLGVALADGQAFALASGESDTSRHLMMLPGDRMLEGSVGKTYVAAVAMRLVAQEKLDLDARIEKYLGDAQWFNRLPNAHDITVRQLMQHTSGLVRYEFQPEATAVLRAQPFKEWTPEDRLAYIFDKTPPFKAGAGWEYSDTNYIVLGMIIEKLLGTTYYSAVKSQVLEPLGLRNTIPSDRRALPGVVNGYAGPRNDLGGYDAAIKDGLMQVNPQFEWTGGGMASTADDLARWGKLLYEGKAFDARVLPAMLTGVPARLGPNTKYGLGVIIRETPEGPLYGHSGFFPGYATEMLYDPRSKVAVAIQANITSPYPRGLVPFLQRTLVTTAAQ